MITHNGKHGNFNLSHFSQKIPLVVQIGHSGLYQISV